MQRTDVAVTSGAMSVLQTHPDRCDVVLLHSLGLDARTFEPVMAAFPASVASWAVDLWGHGFTAMRAPMDLQRVAADVAEVIASAGGPVVLVGVSYGGLIAQHVAATQPHTVAHLVLANTFARWPEAASRDTSYRDAWVAAGSDEEWYRRRERAALVPDASQRARNLYAAACRRNAPDDFFATAPVVYAADAEPLWTQITCPATVMTGELESRIPAHVTAALAKLAGGDDPIVLPGANHLSYLERPREFAEVITRILRR
jgi:3-oxoadipate enol-lactonase